MKFEGVETFIAVAETGSISEAGRQLGLSKSVVSERLAELERSLGARLVQRTTRRLSLTTDGEMFLPRARAIAQGVVDAKTEMAERRGELVGRLRISGPVSFGALHLGPALYPFLRQHPGIELALELDDRFVDVEADGYDAVIRHGPMVEGLLMVARLAPSRRLLVASPGYLESCGVPRSLHELKTHRAILYTNRTADWQFEGAGARITVSPPRALRVNNGLVMRDAAVAGMGVTLLPTFMIHEQVRSGKLRTIDVGIAPEGAEIYVAYPKWPPLSQRLRAIITHLKAAFGRPPYWDLGLEEPAARHQ
jgi:DNA-binding transcriptional LysR family regulator